MFTLLSWIRDPSLRRRIFAERLTEPIHLNLLSVLVALLGSTTRRIEFDLVPRQPYACGLLEAARLTKHYGFSKMTAVELGVADGHGLLNLSLLADAIGRELEIEMKVVGFDGGHGMPRAVDYRDHPDLYQEGDFPMLDADVLRSALPPHAKLVTGELKDTIPAALSELAGDSPIGFVSVDVDYYSSAVAALEILAGACDRYLPMTVVYFDDICRLEHNEWAGELLAIREFNERFERRKLSPDITLRDRRLLKNARWLRQVYLYHVMDHPLRSASKRTAPRVLPNPYLRRAKKTTHL
jgi:hypothetical protein